MPTSEHNETRPGREPIGVGARWSAPPAAATLAVTLTAFDAGLLTDLVVDAVVLLIFITCLAGPLLTSFVGRRIRRREAEPRAPRRDADADGPVRREV